MNIFSHSGDIGDIIYALPTIKAKGGGELILFNSPGKTSHGMTEEKVNRIRPLLELQPYIRSVKWSSNPIESSLNGFRDHTRRHGSLCDAHLATQGLGWEHRAEPWLVVDKKVHAFDVIIQRSPRYNNNNFPWKRIVETYSGNNIGFIGFEDEYVRFCSSFGDVNLVEANNLLEVTQIIAGSKLYIGNQSSPLAIAHGLFHNVIMEVATDHNSHHCIFQRMGCIIGWDHKVILPKLETL